MPPILRAISSSHVLHQPMLQYWTKQEGEFERITVQHLTQTRYARAGNKTTRAGFSGDELVAQVKHVFFEGYGVKWDDNQVKVFTNGLAACLPYIYGDTWRDHQNRVLKEWGLKQVMMYLLVNMARRNGKTFVCSGLVCALLICVPNIKVAIFATCLRTAHLFMSAVVEMMERAYAKGTIRKEDFFPLAKNMETVVYQGPDGSKRTVGCFPGSVRVSVFVFLGGGGGGGGGKIEVSTQKR